MLLELLCSTTRTTVLFYSCFSDQGNDQYMEKSCSDFMSGGLSVAVGYGCDDNHV